MADTAPNGARPGRARDTVGIGRRAAGWDWLKKWLIWQYRIESRSPGPDEFRHRLLPGQRQGGHRDGYVNPGCLKQRPISVSLSLRGSSAA
ncbi:MAG: hypothetical protein GX625_15700 [Clostridiaceae bacterium]|nr:hypothetical protein [Clostridiaceae bacterium]